MLIEFQRDWRGIRAGRIIDWPQGAAGMLIRRQIARAVEAAPKRKGRKG